MKVDNLFVLDFNYSKLHSRKKSFLISRKESVNIPKQRHTAAYQSLRKKGKTSVNSSFALNRTSSTLYFNLLQLRLYQKYVCKFDIFILVAQSKCWTIRQKYTKVAPYLILVGQRRIFLGCNSNGPQQAVKAKKIQFQPGVYLSPILTGLPTGLRPAQWKYTQ